MVAANAQLYGAEAATQVCASVLRSPANSPCTPMEANAAIGLVAIRIMYKCRTDLHDLSKQTRLHMVAQTSASHLLHNIHYSSAWPRHCKTPAYHWGPWLK